MSTTVQPCTRRSLHALPVRDIERLTDDAVAITLDIPHELSDLFAFTPGQHLGVARHDSRTELRRSYSICSAIGAPIRIAVKLLPGGAFSTWAHGELKVGDDLRVMPPTGRFTLAPDASRRRNYVAVVAGSGVTPVLSMVASVLAIEQESSFTLVYGNRSTSSIMFLEELEDLKDRYSTRLQIHHVLSREPQEVELAEGRIDAAKLERLLDTLISAETTDEWFLCGPMDMIEAARSTLLAHCVPSATVHRELFHADETAPPPVPLPARDGDREGAAVAVVLDGRRTELSVPHDGTAILDAMLAKRPDAPYACKGGICGTCRCRILSGEVRMDHAYALEVDEIAAGIRLACQSHPLTDEVVLDFDGA
ncbi:MAG TPA: 1,2-phenylacetyl-CoA epoxidase subunit PaaE [Solirubrobacteraceae bacterium]|jgi:ring-1,2-phenylacetyl-CoA epoxidase subunit PaaE|nr:1,2-phenylacetyl-CoA epoxidase subunit PaaE [Solirubrobacteraceae bacterium]